MSSPVHVRSVAALENLKGALARFGGEAQTMLQAARQEIRRVEEWLQGRLAYWQAEVQRRQEELRLAEATLARCRAAGYRDPRTGAYYTPPCIAEQQAVQQARLNLQKAQAELDNVRQWKYRVDEAASAYSIQAEQLNRLLSGDLSNATAFLGTRIGELQAYLAAAPPATASAPPPSSPLGSAGPALSQGGVGGGTWVDTGIQMVDLDRIDLSNSPVANMGDFHKVSAQEMQEGLRKLEDVVAPAVAQGADGDYFSRLDTAQGLDYAHGYRRIYDAFYGQDCIRLDQVGDHYQVVNGYHRLFLARQMGIKSLPARVIAPKP